MLQILTEKHNGTHSYIMGNYNNKQFKMNWYIRIKKDVFEVFGDFTEQEKKIIINEYVRL
jgi:hypothetical protein